MPKEKSKKPLRQVAALPVMRDASGCLRVLLITSRDTQRFIIPKGWPMKGTNDWSAAAMEAKEEAGVVGQIERKPLGVYTYWKRHSRDLSLVNVDVYLLDVTHQLDDWREKGQRHSIWLEADAAADLVDDQGLAELIRNTCAHADA